MTPSSWIALSYQLPSLPTRLRLAAWRRLKRMGALLLHESVWILPTDGDNKKSSPLDRKTIRFYALLLQLQYPASPESFHRE